MNHFKIDGKQGFILLDFSDMFGFPNEISIDDSYEIRGKLTLKSGNYIVNDAEVWITIGQLHLLFQQLKKAYEQLKENVVFSNIDSSLYFNMTLKVAEGIFIQGYFQENENRLYFELESNLCYIKSTLNELEKMVDHYGDLLGIKKYSAVQYCLSTYH